MKKLTFFLLFSLNIMLIFAQAPTFKSIDEKNIKLGNKYFYAFDGAKWEWTLDLLGNKSHFDWKIKGVYKITDAANNLKDKIALMTICKETGSTWYFIEHDGFLCMYESSDKGYTITKFLPLSPKIGLKWTSNARQSIVTSVTDDFVKIEIEDAKKATSGYKLFRKNVGLYDLFEIEKNRKGQVTTKWTLINYVPPKIEVPATTTTTTVKPAVTTTTTTTVKPASTDVTTTTTVKSAVTTTTTTTVKPAVTTTTTIRPAVTTTTTVKPVTTTTTTVKPAVTTTTTTTTIRPVATTTTTVKPVVTTTTTTTTLRHFADYTDTLPASTALIQVGSFSIQEYAENCYEQYHNAGYECFIFTENNMYKVIVNAGDNKDLINTIKSTVNPNAFYKQRK